MKRKVISLVLASAFVIGALSACAGNNTAPAASSTPASQAPAASSAPASQAPAAPAPAAPAPEGGATGKIIIATENETPSLTVAQHNAVAGTYMNNLTNNGLFRIQFDNLTPVPDLVETYENVSDTVWQFKLKEGVLFHNGEELTAEDVKASLEYVKQFPDCVQYQKVVEKVELVDKYTFTITTPGPSATILNDLSHHGNWIMPKSLIDSGNDFNANPIGTGPYLFKNWTFGDSVSFEANENFFDTARAPKIKDMTWRIIPEGSSRTIALEAGEVDMIIEVATQDIPRMEASGNITVLRVPGTGHNFIMMNNERAPFDNEYFRKALNCAIDKESVVGIALDGLASVTYNTTPNIFDGVSFENLGSYDPEKAKEYLELSGLDLSKIDFAIICSNDQKRRCAEVIQSNLLEVGVTCHLETMDLATYLDVTTTTEYETAIGGYNSSDILSYLTGVYNSASIGASNQARYKNDEVDALIDKAVITLDEAERLVLVEEATKILNAATANVPLYQTLHMRAFNSKLVMPELSANGQMAMHMVYWTE